ncbi:hypothetical protein BH09VER1_BH09VER1_17180 [soil metagenome]
MHRFSLPGIAIFSLGLCAVPLALTLSSCQRPAEKEASTLRVGLGGWMTSQFPVLANLSARFASSNDVSLKLYKFGAAPPPYIMQFRQGRCDEDVILASRFDRFAAVRIGGLEDLGPLLPDVPDRLIGPALREARRTGAFREVPYLGEVMVLNYNRRLLTELGISTPAKNWAELQAQAEQIHLQRPNLTPVGLVLNADSEVYYYYPALLGLAGTCEDQKGWPLTDTPAALAALKTLQDWRHRGLCNGVGVDSFSLFRSGDAVYFISWASHGSMAASSLGSENVGFVPLAGPAYVSFHRGVVPSHRPHPALAAHYLRDVMLSPAFQQAIYAAGKVGVLKEDFASTRLPAAILPLRDQLEHGSIGPSTPYNIDRVNLAIHQAVQGVATGQLTPEEAIRQMTAASRAEQAAIQERQAAQP